MALIITGGFTLLSIVIDTKIITIYDFNPFVSFTFTFLSVGILVGGVAGIRTARRLAKGDEEI